MSRGLYPFGHSRELLARKKNHGLEFELIWRQFYMKMTFGAK